MRVTVNASGNVVSYNDYYPFGALMYGRSQDSSSVDGRYKYTGKERDAETKYDYFGARYYDARIGRFFSVDPLENENPGLTPYGYVSNNPIRLIDLTGKREYPDDYKGPLGPGDWYTSDRILNTERWQEANRFNIRRSRGHREYKTIEQREAFYRWLANELVINQSAIFWPAAAAYINQGIIRGKRRFTPGIIIGLQRPSPLTVLAFISLEALGYMEAIGEIIMENAWSSLSELYKRDIQLEGRRAEEWDNLTVEFEQGNPAVQAMYDKMTPITRVALDGALNTGILLIPFKGSIGVEADRIAYGKKVINNLRTNPELYQQVLQGLNSK